MSRISSSLEHPGEPVRAHSITSPSCELGVHHVDHDVVLGAEGAGDDVAQRVLARLLGGEDALLELLVDPGVVAGDLLDARRRGAGRCGCRRRGRARPRMPSRIEQTMVVPMPLYSFFSWMWASRRSGWRDGWRCGCGCALSDSVLVVLERPGDVARPCWSPG